MTIHIDTPVHAPLAVWSGEYEKEKDFCANYDVLHNGVVLTRAVRAFLQFVRPA